VITCALTVHKEQETTSNTLKRDFWKGNYVKINDELRCINWTDIFTGKSIDKWKIFKGTLLLLVDSYIPFKAVVKKKKVKTLSKNTIRHTKLRNEVWQDYRKQPTEDKFRRYKAVRNKTNSMVRSDHATSRKKTISSFKGNLKSFLLTCAICKLLRTRYFS